MITLIIWYHVYSFHLHQSSEGGAHGVSGACAVRSAGRATASACERATTHFLKDQAMTVLGMDTRRQRARTTRMSASRFPVTEVGTGVNTSD